jgi:hypothetical protein
MPNLINVPKIKPFEDIKNPGDWKPPPIPPPNKSNNWLECIKDCIIDIESIITRLKNGQISKNLNDYIAYIFAISINDITFLNK